MLPMFIKSLVEHNYEALHYKMLIILILWGLVVISIAVDLYSGVRKAKQRNEVRTSIGYRRTVGKVIQYFSVLIFAFLMDCVISLYWGGVPIVSGVAAAYLIFIEFKSVNEKSDEKERKQLTRHLPEFINFVQSVKDKGKLDSLLKLLQNEADTKQNISE